VTCEFRGGNGGARTAQAAIGQASALVSMSPEPHSRRAEAFIAVGKNRAEADRLLDLALQTGFDGLQAEVQKEYTDLLAPAMPHVGNDPASRTRALHDLKALFAALDPASGTVVGAPVHRPPVSAVWPELAAWASLAWQLSGYPEQAKRQMHFYRAPLGAAEDNSKAPAVLPGLLRTDGTAALPTFVHDPSSTSWVVLAVVQLLRHSPPTAASADALAYYEELILPAMHYLRRWAFPANGEPSPGFDPALFRDNSSVSNELECYLAVEGALEVAALAKRQPEPTWQTWQRELDTTLRFRMVNESDGWDLSPTLTAWAAMTLPPENPLRKAAVRTPSGKAILGECTLPGQLASPETAGLDTLESAVDLVALLCANP